MKLHEEERKKSRRYLHALEHDNEVSLSMIRHYNYSINPNSRFYSILPGYVNPEALRHGLVVVEVIVKNELYICNICIYM